MNPALKSTLGAILYDLLQHRTRPRLIVTRVQVGNLVIEGDISMNQLPVDQTALLGPVQPVDAFGNPARIDGAPSWSLSDATGLELLPAADGLTATLRSLDGALRAVQVQVTADADLGAGVENVGGLVDVEFVGGKAASLTVPFQVQ